MKRRRARPRGAVASRPMREPPPPPPSVPPRPLAAWRHYAVLVVLALGAVGLAARAGYLVVTKGEFLERQGAARAVRELSIPVHRGMIFDRNGEPLAVSAPMRYVWVDPQRSTLTPDDLKRLGNALGMAPETLGRRAGVSGERPGRRFAYLARRLPPEVAARVRELDIDGVHVELAYHRFYPAGEAAAHVVGRTDIDDVGQEGVELVLNKRLAGTPGVKRVLRDNRGHVVKVLEYRRAPASDVHLALDLRLQFLAYRELKAAVEHHGASSGSLVMLDVATGEVLALANQPSFNPNDWSRRGVEGVRNGAVADLYEPGSTVKPFTVLAALEAGTHQPDTVIDTSPGYFRVAGKTIEDPSDRGLATVRRILAVSSQVGIAKMALAMAPDAVFNVLQRVGFGDYTGSGLPGEGLGVLTTTDLDKPIGRVTLAYGYGLTVSPMQLARAYLLLANSGIRNDLALLRGATTGERVFATEHVDAVTEMMRAVVAPGGTAPRGKPKGYTAAGKTGTVRKVGASGYDDTAHVAFFAGFAPAPHPRIVLVVAINQPRRGPIGGGQVAAPVFARVVERALRILGVPPQAELPAAVANERGRAV